MAPDFARTIDLKVLVPDVLNLRLELLIAMPASAPTHRVRFLGLVFVVAR